MTIDLSNQDLTNIEREEIEALLHRRNPTIEDDLEQIWYLIDLIWDDYNCDNLNPNWDIIGAFYSHPVWLLNGLFIEQHDLSMQHRHTISNWIVDNNLRYIVDYGGGFGTLARLVAQKSKDIDIDIFEPHPSEFGIKRTSVFENIRIINKLQGDYDCLMCTDVLEHVSDPLNDFADMVKSVKINGFLIIANAFHPVIKCHLPQNFHFRYTFNVIAQKMGLEIVGILEGSHAIIFKKTTFIEPDWKRIRLYEKLSSVAFPIVETFLPILRPIKRLFVR